MFHAKKVTPTAASVSNANSKCQKCLQSGHWTADCPNPPTYKSRPSRTALLKNPPHNSTSQNQPEIDESVEHRIDRERKEIIKQVLSKEDDNQEDTDNTPEIKEKLDQPEISEKEIKDDGLLSSDTDFTTDEELFSKK
jgi:hypothetical protein